MNIGFFVNTCEPYYRGGYELRTATMAKSLVQLGHRVRIFTSASADSNIAGVEYVAVGPLNPFFGTNGVRNGWADLLFVAYALQLFFKWKRRELDVLDICATPFFHLPLLATLCWWKGIPTVVTCHEALLSSLPAYVAERGQRPGLLAWGTTFLLRLVYRVGTACITRRVAVSQQTARGLREEGFSVNATVEFGLEPDAFCPQPHPRAAGPLHFVWCGRLTPIKQVMWSVQALIALRQTRQDFTFTIAGTGSEEAALKAKVERALAGHWIRFLGQISEAEKRDLLQSGDVFILSSPREGFSIATLEAMAAGCFPIILNDPNRPNGALDFVLPDVTGIVAPATPAGLMGALERVFALSVEEKNRFRQSAWSMASRFLAKEQAAKLAESYSC